MKNVSQFNDLEAEHSGLVLSLKYNVNIILTDNVKDGARNISDLDRFWACAFRQDGFLLYAETDSTPIRDFMIGAGRTELEAIKDLEKMLLKNEPYLCYNPVHD